MLSQTETTEYQRNSNAAAGHYGYCSACTKPLQQSETYVCDECAQAAYVEAKESCQISASTPQ